MFLIEKIAEEKIEHALKTGELSSSVLKGKPYRFDGYLYADPEERIVNKILKDNGFLTPVLEYRKKIETLAEQLQLQIREAEQGYASRFKQLLEMLEVEPSYPPESYACHLNQHHVFVNKYLKIWLWLKSNSSVRSSFRLFNAHVARRKNLFMQTVRKLNGLIQEHNEEVVKLFLRGNDHYRIQTTLGYRCEGKWEEFWEYYFPRVPEI